MHAALLVHRLYVLAISMFIPRNASTKEHRMYDAGKLAT